jgi:hypothetical protein
MKELQEVFAENFNRTDLFRACTWLYDWFNYKDQLIAYHPRDYSMRAMCGHVSDYLEGFTGEEPESYNKSRGSYILSKYGSDLFVIMIGFDWPTAESIARQFKIDVSKVADISIDRKEDL